MMQYLAIHTDNSGGFEGTVLETMMEQTKEPRAAMSKLVDMMSCERFAFNFNN